MDLLQLASTFIYNFLISISFDVLIDAKFFSLYGGFGHKNDGQGG